MNLRLLAFAASLALLLPGCVGTAAASAADVRSAADAAAREWSADAQLANVVGVEGSFPMMMEAWRDHGTGRENDFEAARDDEKVGDGKASVWAFRYVSATKSGTFLVLVDADDNVVRTEEMARGPRGAALGAWKLDSDDALRIAKAENQGIREGTESERFGTFALLHMEGGRAVWDVMGGGFGETGAGGGYVRIDASSGDVLANEGSYRSF